jgi:hypothetical protein
MEININEQYFLMSFRFDKTNPEDFGLVPLSEQEDLFIRTRDGSIWRKQELYDLGWGKEYGFIGQPELDFEGLLYLLLNSRIEENQYGAASELLDRYPDELLEKVEQILDKNNIDSLDQKQKKGFLILKLETPLNRSATIGKSFEQINQDFERWKAVSERVSVFTNSRPASQPTVVTKSEMSKQVSTPTVRKEKRPWWKFW